MPLEYGDKMWQQKTGIVGLPCGEKGHDRESNRVGRHSP